MYFPGMLHTPPNFTGGLEPPVSLIIFDGRQKRNITFFPLPYRALVQKRKFGVKIFESSG